MAAGSPRPAFFFAVLLVVLLGAIAMPGCGGGSNNSGGTQIGTPAGTYTIDVAGAITSGTVTTTHDIKLTLTVK